MIKESETLELKKSTSELKEETKLLLICFMRFILLKNGGEA